MTGRAAGYCAGYGMPGYMNPAGGRGMGFGRGMGGGRGRRNWFYATGVPGSARAAAGMPAWGGQTAPYGPAPYAAPYAAYEPTREEETNYLKAQSEALGQQIEEINKRIAELEKEPAK